MGKGLMQFVGRYAVALGLMGVLLGYQNCSGPQSGYQRIPTSVTEIKTESKTFHCEAPKECPFPNEPHP
ncbi:MAG: hypothetical protein IT289_06175 [Oligoflexia bacterium]|nr:hypothetical protein [Oligoflexia bacterium]